ncbi:heme-binding Shp domain-containing protein [Helcococcus ovis]|uniref:heme-binding Shp domain-containing protein n=1 Tax=Helcococcus TaxID=31983 RepID=UPI0014313936|nr:heme-binding Shp domain-containing protein [Helcococcus ovis]WNZ01749.1 heme-binding Shp domain-containing protein [Helcococcus ovis]
MKKRVYICTLIFLISIVNLSEMVFAESGKVFTVNVNPSYKHPITGEIEDSGGEKSVEIGQGMVEGAVYKKGLLEVLDSGEMYLTIKMALFDYTGNHKFLVDENDSEHEFTGSGSDDNGETKDIRIKIINKNSIIKGNMYVEPMGRNVIWFMHISDVVQGNNTDIAQKLVSSNSIEKEKKEEKEEKEEKESKLEKNKKESKLEKNKSKNTNKETKKETSSEKNDTKNEKLISNYNHENKLKKEGLILSTESTVKNASSLKSKGINNTSKFIIFGVISLGILFIIFKALLYIKKRGNRK